MRLIGKYLAVVTTSGGGGGAQVQTYLRNYGNTVGAQCVGGVDAKSLLKPADVADAAAVEKALVAAIQKCMESPLRCVSSKSFVIDAANVNPQYQPRYSTQLGITSYIVNTPCNCAIPTT